MQSYNEFLTRIYQYAEAMAAKGSTRAIQFADCISGKFADLLGAEKDPSLLALFKAYASDCFATTSKVVPDVLKETKFAV